MIEKKDKVFYNSETNVVLITRLSGPDEEKTIQASFKVKMRMHTILNDKRHCVPSKPCPRMETLQVFGIRSLPFSFPFI